MRLYLEKPDRKEKVRLQCTLPDATVAFYYFCMKHKHCSLCGLSRFYNILSSVVVVVATPEVEAKSGTVVLLTDEVEL